MGDLNSVILIGNMTRDAELKYTSSGTAVARLGIATNTRFKRGDQWEDQAHFFDAVLWGRTAEAVSQYLTKGKQVAIVGELRQNRWEDRETGQRRSKVEINVRRLQLLGGRDDGGGSATGPARQESPTNDFEDDIPF